MIENRLRQAVGFGGDVSLVDWGAATRWRPTKVGAWIVTLGCVFLSPVLGYELDPRQDRVNLSSQSGVPLSETAGDPAGSNGLAPTQDAQRLKGLTEATPTQGQFHSVVPFSGGRTEIAPTGSSTGFSVSRVRIGYPYFGQAEVFQFGEIIPPPSLAEDGSTEVDPETYWNPKPVNAGFATAMFHYSPHVEAVYGSDVGQVEILWRRNEEGKPSDLGTLDSDNLALDAAGDEWVAVGTQFYQVLRQTVQVTGVPVKTPRKIFWNAGEFEGPAVSMPSGTVKEIVLVFNEDFPSTIDDGIDDEDQDNPEGTSLVPGISGNEVLEKRTMFERTIQPLTQLVALNREGRLMIELLGDRIDGSDGLREQLGIEIVEVIDSAAEVDVEAWVGEALRTGVEKEIEGSLFPVVVNSTQVFDLYFEQQGAEGEPPTLYSTGETSEFDTNEFRVFWLEEGIAGIQWPVQLSRYTMRWPTGVGDYAHYLRPVVGNALDAQFTSVGLPAANAPFLEAYDALGDSIAEINGSNRFYTFLDGQTAAMRSLLRYSAGSEVFFERVFSWREDLLLSATADLSNIAEFEVLGVFYDGEDEFQYLDGIEEVAVSPDGSIIAVLAVWDDTVSFYSRETESGVLALLETFTHAEHRNLNGVNNAAFAEEFVFVSAPTSQSVGVFHLSDEGTAYLGGFGSDEVSGDTSPSYVGRPVSVAVTADASVLAVGGEDRSDQGTVASISLIDIGSLTEGTTEPEAWSATLFSPNAEIISGTELPLQEDASLTHTIELLGSVILDVYTDANGLDYLFAADSEGGGVHVLEISDPANPTYITEWVDGEGDWEYLGSISDILVDASQNLLVVASASSEDAVTLVNIVDPYHPEILSTLVHKQNVSSMNNPVDLAIDASVLAVASGSSDSINTFDLTNPYQPALIGQLLEQDGNGVPLERPQSVAVFGDTMYSANDSSEDTDSLTVMRISQRSEDVWDASGFAESVAAELDAFDSATQTFNFNGIEAAPRVVYQTAFVGQRLSAPSGELGASGSESYLAGHVEPIYVDVSADATEVSLEDIGDSYSVSAYREPLDALVGFNVANAGGIIPINAIPGENQLNVWWFRENASNSDLGFDNTYWPSTLGRYTIEWPVDPLEIVLASNDGSGDLSDIASGAEDGVIYSQPDPALAGYNPNEEHALVSGGTAFALRDDLNITEARNVSVGGYSSEPFVLLEYEDTDGRPDMLAFQVLRDKPSEGLTFDAWRIEAGTVVQGPMPLPLLEAPVPNTDTDIPTLNAENVYRTILNSEVVDYENGIVDLRIGGAIPSGVLDSFFLKDYSDGTDGALVHFVTLEIVEDDPAAFTVRGMVSDHAPTLLNGVDRQSSTIITSSNPDEYQTTWNYTFHIPNAALETFQMTDFASSDAWMYLMGVDRETGSLISEYALVTGADALEFTVEGSETASEYRTEIVGLLANDETLYSHAIPVAASSLFTSEETPAQIASPFDGWIVHTSLLDGQVVLDDLDAQSHYLSMTITDRKGNIWCYRGPSDPEASTPETFQMRFSYPVIEGFDFPDGNDAAAVGEITPYLRVATPTFVDEVASLEYSGPGGVMYYEGSADTLETGALPVTFIPEWPSDAPLLHTGETLTLPKGGLPDIRGNTSLEVLYEQSIALSLDSTREKSVTLHDSTREKIVLLDEDATGLTEIPATAVTSDYLGDTFFPNLPPHLSERFFFDPTRGSMGGLVLKGEFIDAGTGDDYLFTNVAKLIGDANGDDFEDSDEVWGGDLYELRSIVSDSDPEKEAWDAAVNQLTATVELFTEDPDAPGIYIVGSSTTVGVDEVVEIGDDDVAVDSYALTATGPKTGYVTLIAGNGNAFTDPSDPVALHVLKVVDTLYQGELKAILSSNPLSEKMTMQQVVDLTGAVFDDYVFEWKKAADNEGYPDVFSVSSSTLITTELWDHYRWPTLAALEDASASIALDSVDADDGNVIVGNLIDSVSFTASAETPASASGSDTADGWLVVVSQEVGSLLSVGMDLEMTEGDLVVRHELTKIEGEDSDSEWTLSLVPEDVSGEGLLSAPDGLREIMGDLVPDSVLYGTFDTSTDLDYRELWLGVDLDASLAAEVRVNDVLVAEIGMSGLETSRSDSVAVTAPSGGATEGLDGYPLDIGVLGEASNHSVEIRIFGLRSGDAIADWDQDYRAAFVMEILDYSDDTVDNGWISLADSRFPDGIRSVIGGSADVDALSDNWIIMRYGVTGASNAVNYSEWTTPQLAEGWIKRVLAGINPFNQRTTDFFNNAIDTDASMLTLAGARWEGDVALNSDTINDYGLIEIYETVLNRGRSLSIDAGINYGPANDALLLVAGYINDLYMFLGGEAYADALNPTIGFGTSDGELGDFATALYSFQGQMGSLLEEELALIRGRDDSLVPGVEVNPVYNRLYWNYTRGIDSGEIVYALNYNIQENQNSDFNGIIDAEDAAALYPQGHGDAYGHYLTALKGYYSLLAHPEFTWVPRTESVVVLGQAVQVDYTDEQKFANASVSLANAGKKVVDLTWRQDYEADSGSGWEHFGAGAINEGDTRDRHWGMDQWASRTGQGALINWAVGNSILPAVDDNPDHEGIQVIDRTTVVELEQLTLVSDELQTTMDNAEAHLNPLGMAEHAVAFDISPRSGFNTGESTHFEQVLERSKVALENAVVAFDDAKDVTRLMRSEEGSLAELQEDVSRQENAFENQLIEIYGTPYADDIGPGATYETGYDGPDLVHYMYVDIEELTVGDWLEPMEDNVFLIDLQDNIFEGNEYRELWRGTLKDQLNKRDSESALGTNYPGDDFEIDGVEKTVGSGGNTEVDSSLTLEYELSAHGFFGKPSDWQGSRSSPGSLQLAINDIILATNDLREALDNHEGLKYQLDQEMNLFEDKVRTHEEIRSIEYGRNVATSVFNAIKSVADIWDKTHEQAIKVLDEGNEALLEGIPNSQIFGFSNGGDLLAGLRGSLSGVKVSAEKVLSGWDLVRFTLFTGAEIAFQEEEVWVPFYEIAPREWEQEILEDLHGLDGTFGDMQGSVVDINRKIQLLSEKRSLYSSLAAKGIRVQAERESFRKRAAALTQGFRSRDAAFRVLRDEKLERYNTLFDLAARYAFLAAKAFDYETGLLHTQEGQAFIERIVSARALGVVEEGKPQFAGSDSGDPGLSSILAEMESDWNVLEGRLGFNNPDIYGTTVSLRSENYRILPGVDGDSEWRDVLEGGRMANILEDEDVKLHCMQIDPGTGAPVPGIVIDFGTEIMEGMNLFGNDLAGGDHAFSPTSFATKIFSVGIALEGYPGLDDPNANTSATGTDLEDPFAAWLEPATLSATPYVYLIPVGEDIMRSPPLGDESVLRSWTVQDVTIPLPFNIGASDFSTQAVYQSADSLTEPLFSIRKHQAFRPVASTDTFEGNPRYFPSYYTNSRLIGRSVWNTGWKLVIPGNTLLNDAEQGLDILIDHLTDIQLRFETYSYSGN